MIAAFGVDCNFRCWDCPRDCKMKNMMQELPEPVFNQCILDSMKSNAGMRIAILGLSPEKANDYVMQNTVALSIARKKYLETLQKSR